MGNGMVKGARTLGPVWAGSERSGGERSEPPGTRHTPPRLRALAFAGLRRAMLLLLLAAI
jgi:hypothetical protein